MVEKINAVSEQKYVDILSNGELAAAREDGIAKGHAEGLAEGRIEGREEANMDVAKKMLAAGIPVEHIAQFTGLNPEVIESLK